MFPAEIPSQAKAWQGVCGVEGPAPLIRLILRTPGQRPSGDCSALPPWSRLGAWRSLVDSTVDSGWMSGWVGLTLPSLIWEGRTPAPSVSQRSRPAAQTVRR